MTDQWLGSTEKLMIFFGGFNCISPFIEKEEARLDEEDARTQKESHSSEPIVHYIQDLREPIQLLRSKIIQMLSARADIQNVDDLFEQTNVSEFFDPIVFKLKIPKSLLSPRETHREGSASVSEFTIVYDGRILMIVVMVPIGKYPYEIPKVFFKLQEILKNACDSERVAPCPTHRALTIVNDLAKDSDRYKGLYIQALTDHDGPEHIRHIYANLYHPLHLFYSACHFRTKVARAASRIADFEKEFIKTTRSFMKTEWYHILERRKKVSELRSKCIDIFAEVSDFLSDTQELNEGISEVQEEKDHTTLFRQLMDEMGLDEYTKAAVINVESVMRVIQHVEGELETYSVSSSAINSAVIGGIVGSALTMLATFLLHI